MRVNLFKIKFKTANNNIAISKPVVDIEWELFTQKIVYLHATHFTRTARSIEGSLIFFFLIWEH